MIKRKSLCSVALVLLVLCACTCEAGSPSAVMPESSRDLFARHCFQCHDADTQEGKVRLDDLPLHIKDVATADRWQKVLGVLNSGEMPPEDERPLADSEKTSFLETLSAQMVVARDRSER